MDQNSFILANNIKLCLPCSDELRKKSFIYSVKTKEETICCENAQKMTQYKKSRLYSRKVFFCPFCNFTGDSRKSSLKHCNFHTAMNEIQDLTCKICNQGGFPFMKNLSHHFKHDHKFDIEKNDYEFCPFCGETYFCYGFSFQIHYLLNCKKK